MDPWGTPHCRFLLHVVFSFTLTLTLASGSMPVSLRCAFISLTFKLGDRLEHKNWRPISLNVDYKSCARSLAGRILNVLHHVIPSDQTCGVRGRFVGESVAQFRDAIHYTSLLSPSCPGTRRRLLAELIRLFFSGSLSILVSAHLSSRGPRFSTLTSAVPSSSMGILQIVSSISWGVARVSTLPLVLCHLHRSSSSQSSRTSLYCGFKALGHFPAFAHIREIKHDVALDGKRYKNETFAIRLQLFLQKSENICISGK